MTSSLWSVSSQLKETYLNTQTELSCKIFQHRVAVNRALCKDSCYIRVMWLTQRCCYHKTVVCPHSLFVNLSYCLLNNTAVTHWGHDSVMVHEHNKSRPMILDRKLTPEVLPAESMAWLDFRRSCCIKLHINKVNLILLKLLCFKMLVELKYSVLYVHEERTLTSKNSCWWCERAACLRVFSLQNFEFASLNVRWMTDKNTLTK